MNICLRVLKDTNKSRYDTYSVNGVPYVKMCSPPRELQRGNRSDTTFQIGYYADGKKKYSISSEIQLAEALSLAKNGVITLWVDPDKHPSRVPQGKTEGKVLFTNALKQAIFCRICV